ncbi:hypothetical protein ACN47E_007984 [Coniothyrium glycines]
MTSPAVDLPEVNEFLTKHVKTEDIERLKAIEADEDKACALCSERFDIEMLELCIDVADVVSVSSCAHLFHLPCLKKWLAGTQATRNLCPVDRIPFCQLNALSTSEQEGLNREINAMFPPTTNIDASAALARITEFLVQQQDAQLHGIGYAEYTHIPAKAREAWQRQHPRTTIDDTHHAVGADYLELVSAHHIAGMLHTQDAGIGKGQAACEFRGWLEGKEKWFENRYPEIYDETEEAVEVNPNVALSPLRTLYEVASQGSLDEGSDADSASASDADEVGDVYVPTNRSSSREIT